ncbi:extracellular catalytic domain type 1 short-chain-length polyhydroxyalkanoate depolymerase [Xanthobacter flavus]|uniref:extracellular catalytic domain type 1 short-chain-length polyhydroxyalkanoate depolymerase n=1 Tax=Xanthobacter flavus TaxID=281 RepID=UPI001AEB5E0F|nr:PHB depolymerase family esterase [Xanthobacter flavus]MBP2150976.1 poly(hydroxyalkanoate) depolymerase family esterase [Xanthobacter flavus]
MARRSKIDVLEATRLTRQGRLQEAMDVLRRGFARSRDVDDHPTGDDSATAFVDLAPPSAATGNTWTVPSPPMRQPRQAKPAPVPLAGGMLDRLRSHQAGGELDLRIASVAPKAFVGEGSRFEEHSFANDAGRRTYKLYVPGRFDEQPLPLLVMLHGCTQSPDDFAAGTRMNELAEEHGFLVAYPAQSRDANASGCWNWFNAGDQRRDRGEPSLIAGITRKIMDEYPVDSARVFVAGLSAGGATAAIMGATYPDIFSAVGVHSGLACGAARDMPSAFAAMRQGGTPSATAPHRVDGRTVPTIVFHGDGDRTVNPLNGEQVIAQVAAQANAEVERVVTVTSGKSAGGTSFTRRVQSDADGRRLLEHWVVHGVGHAWSGGSPSGSYTDPRGPDASREMVRFFLDNGPSAGE